MADLTTLIERVRGLTELRERVASGQLNEFDRCWLATLGTGTLVGVLGVNRGDDGGDEFAALVDVPGGRRRVYLPERDMPDVSVDAALAFAERVLPACQWSCGNSDHKGLSWATLINPHDFSREYCAFEASTVPLAIILATLTALSHTQAGESHDHE